MNEFTDYFNETQSIFLLLWRGSRNFPYIFVIMLLGIPLLFIVLLSYILLGTDYIETNSQKLIIILISSLIFVLILFLGILFRQFKTRITKEGIFVEFKPYPWKPKFYSWENIEKAYIEKDVDERYHYTQDYPRGKTYSYAMFGGSLPHFNKGDISFRVMSPHDLVLVLKDGKKCYIGTHEPEELERVLRKAGKS